MNRTNDAHLLPCFRQKFLVVNQVFEFSYQKRFLYERRRLKHNCATSPNLNLFWITLCESQVLEICIATRTGVRYVVILFPGFFVRWGYQLCFCFHGFAISFWNCSKGVVFFCFSFYHLGNPNCGCLYYISNCELCSLICFIILDFMMGGITGLI